MGLVYTRPNDNLLPTATLSLSAGTLLANSALANLYDLSLAKALMLSDMTLDLRIDHGSAKSVAFVSFLHSNVDVVARFQTDAANDFSSPVEDETFGIPAVSQAGRYSATWINTSGHAAARWNRLLISGNTLPVTIGLLWLSQAYRTFTVAKGFQHRGLRIDPAYGLNSIEASHGIDLTYNQSPRREAFLGTVKVPDAELSDVDDLIDAARGGSRPFVAVPDDRKDRAYLLRLLPGAGVRVPLGPNYYEVALPMREVSSGLAWVDPDA